MCGVDQFLTMHLTLWFIGGMVFVWTTLCFDCHPVDFDAIVLLQCIDKASNGNVVFVCQNYYIQCLIKELGMRSNSEQNTIYQATNFCKREILSNHKSVLSSHGISSSEKDDIPLLYWITKLHKHPYKQRFIAGPSTCSTKPLSKLLRIILSKIKDGLKTIY